MKAVLVNPDRSLSWSEVPTPVPAADEVLVKIACAGVNRADLMQRAGDYPPPPGCPDWMGLEISGTVAALGSEAADRSPWRVGDRVCALLGGGGYAQYAAVRWDMLMPVPEGCSLPEAAALPEAFATAYLNLFWEGGAKAGETLLVPAGASGLASVIIPMAKAFGLRVLTTVRRGEQVEKIAHLGADRIICTAAESLTDVLQEELAAGHGVDLAIDCVGGALMGKCLPYMERGGRWIMIAALAGAMTEVDLKNVYVKNIRIIGSTLRSRPAEVKAALLRELAARVWPRVSSGEIRPTIDRTFPITSAEAAHDLLERGDNVGKTVLTVE